MNQQTDQSSGHRAEQQPDNGSSKATVKKSRIRYGEFTIVAILVVISVILLLGRQTIEVVGDTTPGPLFLPTLLGIAGLVVAAALAVDIVVSGRRSTAETHIEDGSFSGDMLEDLGQVTEEAKDIAVSTEDKATAAPFLIIGGFVVVILALPYLGWILGSAALFGIVNYALGSRNWWRDIAVALLVGSITYLLFVTGLGLNLPSGIWGNI